MTSVVFADAIVMQISDSVVHLIESDFTISAAPISVAVGFGRTLQGFDHVPLDDEPFDEVHSYEITTTNTGFATYTTDVYGNPLYYEFPSDTRVDSSTGVSPTHGVGFDHISFDDETFDFDHGQVNSTHGTGFDHVTFDDESFDFTHELAELFPLDVPDVDHLLLENAHPPEFIPIRRLFTQQISSTRNRVLFNMDARRILERYPSSFVAKKVAFGRGWTTLTALTPSVGVSPTPADPTARNSLHSILNQIVDDVYVFRLVLPTHAESIGWFRNTYELYSWNMAVSQGYLGSADTWTDYVKDSRNSQIPGLITVDIAETLDVSASLTVSNIRSADVGEPIVFTLTGSTPLPSLPRLYMSPYKAADAITQGTDFAKYLQDVSSLVRPIIGYLAAVETVVEATDTPSEYVIKLPDGSLLTPLMVGMTGGFEVTPDPSVPMLSIRGASSSTFGGALVSSPVRVPHSDYFKVVQNAYDFVWILEQTFTIDRFKAYTLNKPAMGDGFTTQRSAHLEVTQAGITDGNSIVAIPVNLDTKAGYTACVVDGVIENPLWSWTKIGKLIYADTVTGDIVEDTPANGISVYVKLGVILSPTRIRMTINASFTDALTTVADVPVYKYTGFESNVSYADNMRTHVVYPTAFASNGMSIKSPTTVKSLISEQLRIFDDQVEQTIQFI